MDTNMYESEGLFDEHEIAFENYFTKDICFISIANSFEVRVDSCALQQRLKGYHF